MAEVTLTASRKAILLSKYNSSLIDGLISSPVLAVVAICKMP